MFPHIFSLYLKFPVFAFYSPYMSSKFPISPVCPVHFQYDRFDANMWILFLSSIASDVLSLMIKADMVRSTPPMMIVDKLSLSQLLISINRYRRRYERTCSIPVVSSVWRWREEICERRWFLFLGSYFEEEKRWFAPENFVGRRWKVVKGRKFSWKKDSDSQGWEKSAILIFILVVARFSQPSEMAITENSSPGDSRITIEVKEKISKRVEEVSPESVTVSLKNLQLLSPLLVSMVAFATVVLIYEMLHKCIKVWSNCGIN